MISMQNSMLRNQKVETKSEVENFLLKWNEILLFVFNTYFPTKMREKNQLPSVILKIC